MPAQPNFSGRQHAAADTTTTTSARATRPRTNEDVFNPEAMARSLFALAAAIQQDRRSQAPGAPAPAALPNASGPFEDDLDATEIEIDEKFEALFEEPPLELTRRELQEGEDTMCVICLDSMAGQEISQLPRCGHVFHGECLGPWVETNETCPMCRAGIRGGERGEEKEGEEQEEEEEDGGWGVFFGGWTWGEIVREVGRL